MRTTYLTRTPISIDALLAEVAGPDRGGTCLFLGTVRNGPEEQGVTAIEYSAYEAMVEAEFGRLLADAGQRWPDTRIAVRHRLGGIPSGEASIAIPAAAPPRAEAFPPCPFRFEEAKRAIPAGTDERAGSGDRGPGADHERPAAREAGGGVAGGGPAARHGEPRHAPSRAHARVREERAARRRARRHPGRARRGLRAPEAQQRGDPRVQRRRAGRSDRVRSRRGRRVAVHRVHGRWRGDPLVHGPGGVAARHARRVDTALRPHHSSSRRWPGPRRAVPPAGRHDLR